MTPVTAETREPAVLSQEAWYYEMQAKSHASMDRMFIEMDRIQVYPLIHIQLEMYADYMAMTMDLLDDDKPLSDSLKDNLDILSSRKAALATHLSTVLEGRSGYDKCRVDIKDCLAMHTHGNRKQLASGVHASTSTKGLAGKLEVGVGANDEEVLQLINKQLALRNSHLKIKNELLNDANTSMEGHKEVIDRLNMRKAELATELETILKKSNHQPAQANILTETIGYGVKCKMRRMADETELDKETGGDQYDSNTAKDSRCYAFLRRIGRFFRSKFRKDNQ